MVDLIIVLISLIIGITIGWILKGKSQPTDSADSWGSLAIDFMTINDGEGNSLMFVYERSYKHLLLQGGIGFTSAYRRERNGYCSSIYYKTESSCENANKNWYEDEDGYERAESLGLRLGVGYQFRIEKHFVIKPAYELNLGFE